MLNLNNVKLVQRMAREGRLPVRRLLGRRRYMFLRDEVVEWLPSDKTRVTPSE